MKTLNDHIEESLIKSYDTNKLISIIYKKYPDIQYNFNKLKSKEFLFVIDLTKSLIMMVSLKIFIFNTN